MTTSTALERVGRQIKEGEIVSLEAVLEKVARAAVPTERPTNLPVPRRATPAQLEAVKRLPEVYAKVVPEEVRVMTSEEVAALADERNILKTVEKMVKTRVDDIALTVHNHLDSEIPADEAEEITDFTKTGNYVKSGAIPIPGTDQKFDRTVSNPKPVLSPEKLAEVAQDDGFPDFTWDDYLSMTRQIRVVDEAKVMEAVRKNPALIKAIGEASERPNPNASIYVRNR